MFGQWGFLDNQTCWLSETIIYIRHSYTHNYNEMKYANLMKLAGPKSLIIQKASEGCVSRGRVFQPVNPGEVPITMHLHLRDKGTDLRGGFGILSASPHKATPSVSVSHICIWCNIWKRGSTGKKKYLK